MQDFDGLTFAYTLDGGEEQTIRRITENTRFFTQEEYGIAEELAADNIARGAEVSGYHFVTVRQNCDIIAYSCYGRVPGSDASYDLYWIVVDKPYSGKGIGSRLLHETERLVALSGGRNIYAETSSTDMYSSTRAFYEKNGYKKEAILKDFYREGDDKVIYSKRLIAYKKSSSKVMLDL